MTAKKPESKSKMAPPVSAEEEAAVGITAEALCALYILDSISGFGPQKFKQLHEQGVPIWDVVEDSKKFKLKGKRGDELRRRLARVTEKTRADCYQRALRQIHSAYAARATILTYDSVDYPKRVFRSNNPSAILYVRGGHSALNTPLAVACVGSRTIRLPYLELHEAFARSAVALGAAVVSGFALGADSIGHRAAFEAGGHTVCCMPGGLDRPFPPENKALWQSLLSYPNAVFVSEYPFGTGASALTLKRRNKLIVAFSDGVLVSQSSRSGGAMNAWRFAREQKKRVATFAADGSDDTSGNELMAMERRPGDVIFSCTETEEEYRPWLHALSSSI